MGSSLSSPSSAQSSSQSKNSNNYTQAIPVQFDYNIRDPNLILKPFLYLGSAYGMRNPSLLEYLGVTHVLNMAMELPMSFELINNPRIKLRHILADDSEKYNIRFDFEQAFEFIDEAHMQGGKVLVHCMMGISRSATIVIAYIMSRYRLSFNSAYNLVKSLRPEIHPNRYFVNILKQYEQELAYYDSQNYYHPTPHHAPRSSSSSRRTKKENRHIPNVNRSLHTSRTSLNNYDQYNTQYF